MTRIYLDGMCLAIIELTQMAAGNVWISSTVIEAITPAKGGVLRYSKDDI